MAIIGIGNSQAVLRLVQNGKIYDVRVKDSIKITREINSASRLSCSIYRNVITPEPGNVVAFILDGGHNQFYGYIVDTNKHQEWCDIEAYDQLYYMNRNKSRMNYEDITATELLERLCKDRGYGILDPPQFEDTEYKIPARNEENVTDLTIITTALDLTYDNTGKRFYLWDDYGSLSLTSESWMAGETTVTITMGFLEDYSYKETLEGAYTTSRVEKTVTPTDENKAGIETYTSQNDAAVTQFGRLEIFDTADSEENGEEKAKQLLEHNLPPVRSLSLSGVQGDITVRGGTPVLVDFFSRDQKELIRGWFRTTSVTHTVENNHHTMDLECELIKMLDDWGNTDPSYYSFYSNTKNSYSIR